MKLTCPSCGAIHSAEGWSADAVARQCLRLVGELPGGVSRRCLAYLALFRPHTGRGLRWSTVLRLLGELKALVGDYYISWDKKPSRKNSAAAWAQAMERVIECPPKRLPLKSHGYLRAIAYDIANEMDRADEKVRNRDERKGGVRYMEAGERLHGEPERVSAEELKAIADRNFRKRKNT